MLSATSGTPTFSLLNLLLLQLSIVDFMRLVLFYVCFFFVFLFFHFVSVFFFFFDFSNKKRSFFGQLPITLLGQFRLVFRFVS